MRGCDGCRFCCWAYEVPDTKVPTKAHEHCQHECVKGCEIHEERPKGCREFFCLYSDGNNIHRPDTFQELLEELGGNIGSFIPVIPFTIPVKVANELIRRTRTILASFAVEESWKVTVTSLDKKEDGTWETKPDDVEWLEICKKYNTVLGVDLVRITGGNLGYRGQGGDN